MKILVGVDGSEGSFTAAQTVGQWIDPARDQLAIYYAPPPIRATGHPPEILDRARQSLAAAVFEEIRRRLPTALEQSVHAIVGQQPVTAGLITAAHQWQADVIVVGARG